MMKMKHHYFIQPLQELLSWVFFVFFYWQPIISKFFPFFIGVGVFYSLGLYLQIVALSKARASIIQPFHYTLIFWAIILGYIFYQDIPDMFTIIGATIIASSGIYIFIKQNN